MNFEVTAGLWYLMILIAFGLDFLIGDPSFLMHPVRIIGKLISFLTRRLNRGKNREFKGFLMWLIVVSLTYLVTVALQQLCLYINFYLYLVFNIWFLSTALAEKSLYDFAKRPIQALKENNIEEARKFTGEIVSRNTNNLTKTEILRAVVESEAENGIDGVIAPLIYMLAGIPLSVWIPYVNPLTCAYVYKAINTLDSMVGYIYEPYTDFGYFSAKSDDIINFIPARIGSIMYLIAGWLMGYDWKQAYHIYLSFKNNHFSPNAGHPESAIAGLLGIQLGGPNKYFGNISNRPIIGIPIYTIEALDVDSVMHIILVAELLTVLFGGILVTFCYFLYDLFFM